MLRKLTFTFAVAFSLTCAAHAEPLVKMEGGKPLPGVITAWKSKGKDVTLTVKEGVDPKSVADAIQESVPKVKAKVNAGKVQVLGKTEKELLEALAGVDFGEAELEMAAAGAKEDDDVGSGSSLRAKKAADLAKLFADTKTSAKGTVTEVVQGSFPEATVSVKVLQGPEGDLGNTVRKGQTVKVMPAIPKKGGAVDWAHEDAQQNALGWYLKPGDKVRVKIGKATGGGFEAVVIDRE